MRKVLFFFICTFILFSCDFRKIKIQKELQEWQQKTLVFPPLQMKILGKDTTCPELLHAPYKILSHVDTSNCTPCNLHLYDWKIFIREVKKKNKDVNFIFILHLKDYDEYVKLQHVNKFHYPVFYDPQNLFCKENKLPANTSFHTFLLDKNNKVIAIGNPIINFHIRELYLQVITDSIKSSN